MMFPNPDLVPRLPVMRAALREARLVDVELHPEATESFDYLGLRAGDVVQLSEAPVEPDGALFCIEQVSRSGKNGGLAITLRPIGPLLEEGKILVKGLLTGSKFTIVTGGRMGDFTVHRNITVEAGTALKLHFAHGSQMHKLQLSSGSSIKIKERPCGIEEWVVLEAHTENLERCPNCRTGLSGPRAKDFDAADLCAPGTQWATVYPRNRPPEGYYFYAERTSPAKPLLEGLPPFMRFVARPDPRRGDAQG